MVPATTSTRGGHSAKAIGANANHAAPPGAAPESFEHTLKQVGKRRDQARTEAPTEPQSERAAQTDVEETAVEELQEGQEPKKAKPAKDAKEKRHAQELDEDAEELDPAAAEAVFNLTQVLIDDEAPAPEHEMETMTEDQPPREIDEPAVKYEREDVLQLGDTATTVASAEWSLPGADSPAIAQDAAPLVVENIALQGFQAD